MMTVMMAVAFCWRYVTMLFKAVILFGFKLKCRVSYSVL